MKCLTVIVIFCHLALLVEPAFASQYQQQDMKITAHKNNSLIGDRGSRHGLAVGMVFNIIQNGMIIGRAVVKIVKDGRCGLKISQMERGYRPIVGDRLTAVDNADFEEQNIFSEMQNSAFTADKLTGIDQASYDNHPSDLYYEGQTAGDNDYGSAFGGGFAAGFLGGLIGWGIGYAIISSKGTEVATRYLMGLDNKKRQQFISGYKEKVKSKRKKSFNTGALTGTLVIVAVFLLSAGSSE